ncbi:sensor histidine kinase [Colwellia sp. D2M02]|uniref:sensor histidine kinase n=1 Tax=Colwellia sp. D2M02 TaxID=2841562 RepID=UPI001C085E2E|nr:HAMP domain-containing sensor histidine kinase [Colwellia sp. D2M02]MBU2893729.1 sensor histidine kinase [Colwellia sp. D2M02]
MTHFLKGANQVQAIIALRGVAIIIQVLLILFVNIALKYQLPWAPLFFIIAVEVAFTLASMLYYKQASMLNQNSAQQQKAILIQTSADIIFLSCLLFFSGGATNAFVSLLLIPIAIAAVTLTPALLSLVALLAIGSYSILLWLLPMSVMHGNMQGHFIAMGINFLFSALVVAIVVGKMARSINKQQLAIAKYRENLLKQEQVTSLGVAAAQVTHQLATPITTVQLLADELSEDFPNSEVIGDMQVQLARCRVSLDEFREMVFSIKEQRITAISTQTLLNEIKANVEVNYPEIALDIEQLNHESTMVMADAALMPAILNLINNAVRATKNNGSSALVITSMTCEKNWQLIIRDFGKGFTLKKLNELGVKPVTSTQGLGMAVFLSHASLERIGGKLTLTNHIEGGALVTLSLPCQTTQQPTANK